MSTRGIANISHDVASEIRISRSQTMQFAFLYNSFVRIAVPINLEKDFFSENELPEESAWSPYTLARYV